MPSFLHKKLLTFLLLAALALSLSGCVYLRLLALKKQLARFDENFTTESSDGIAIRCLHPVLLGDDLRWLGAGPKDVIAEQDGENWRIRWVKEPPPGVTEAAIYDVEIDARLAQGRLARVRIPERFFAYFPKELFLSLLRSAGTAKVDRGERTTESRTETPPTVSLPGLSTIAGMLGQPTRQHREQDMILYLYRYRPDTDASGVKPLEVTFVFDSASGVLQRLIGRLPRGTLNFDFSKPRSQGSAATH